MTLPVRRSTVELEPERGDLVSWDPASEFDRLSRRMMELFDTVWTRPLATDGGFTPAADLEETDDAFVLEIELPGVARGDIEVELAGRRLTVTGERKEKERTGVLRRRTRTVGRFSYEVVFPGEVDDEHVTADYHDGLLTVTVPKTATEKARHIQIR